MIHYSSRDTEELRSLNLKGSNDGKYWILISQYVNDQALKTNLIVHTLGIWIQIIILAILQYI